MTGPSADEPSASEQTLLLAKAHYPVTTLGPGVRAGIWTQGCTLHCPGCLSRDTWEADPGKAVPVAAVLGWLRSLPRPLDGVTVSGGEPFQQPEALAALLRGIRAWQDGSEHETIPVDILVYSGYVYSRLLRSARTSEILGLCDAVITGPYVDRLNPGGDTPRTALYSGGVVQPAHRPAVPAGARAVRSSGRRLPADRSRGSAPSPGVGGRGAGGKAGVLHRDPAEG
ncbi:4Fe-4S single cluster domain-containing protein [Actinomadura keratinilytica]|uniref:4Fe-4S single cluster domain-containing protein n=1 Tax=Actinomadura keratinilytica TaxID=547461 RepID=UPI00360D4A4A